ncbi:MAG TPA: hypothetical protein VJ997_05305 [Longimicrobiales bacterium]|nr:hypothetical protein [Longimicrobiales bacterium]
MSDGIIDFGEYVRRRDGPDQPASTFALFGADGERSRFALPLWRAIYLASGERGGVFSQELAGGALEPFVVLDLATDPPRTEFPWPESLDPGERAPHLLEAPGGGLAIFLGEERERRWYLLVHGSSDPLPAPVGRDREDIMFLAGECAGLLFLRRFASDSGEPEDSED